MLALFSPRYICVLVLVGLFVCVFVNVGSNHFVVDERIHVCFKLLVELKCVCVFVNYVVAPVCT
jgi:hypothetical protein